MTGSIDFELLHRACRRGELPMPPSSTRLTLALAADEESDGERLAEQIESDPRQRFALLVGANLSLLAGSRAALTVRQAIGRLGRRNVSAILWLAALSDLVRQCTDRHPRGIDRLWKHSLLTAVVARQLFATAGAMRLGDPLAAGMAHDMGHLILRGAGARLAVVWFDENEALARSPQPAAPERDHCRLGEALLSFWGAPQEFAVVARHHHEPARAGEHASFVAGIRLADLLAEYVELERVPRRPRLDATPEWMEPAAIEPWSEIREMSRLAIEQLPEAILTAEHLARVLA